MTYSAQDLARVRNPLLLISAVAWIAIVLNSRGAVTLAHCPAPSPGAMPFPAPLNLLFTLNGLVSISAGWALMLVAMMSPVLISPILHIRLRSFTRRRGRSIALFAGGYAAIWMAVGGALAGLAVAVKWRAAQSYLPAAGIALLALIWQLSPFKQRCLNRCHAHTELAAFGAAADLAALRFGIVHGIWCAGSCWALMLFPMLLARGHVVAMTAAAGLIFGERLEPPMPPRWRWRGVGKLMRIVAAQARTRQQTRPLNPTPSPFHA